MQRAVHQGRTGPGLKKKQQNKQVCKFKSKQKKKESTTTSVNDPVQATYKEGKAVGAAGHVGHDFVDVHFLFAQVAQVICIRRVSAVA